MNRRIIGVTGTLAAVAAMLLVPAAAVPQCLGDSNGDNVVTVAEVVAVVDRALMTRCEDDNICAASVKLLATGETTSYGPGSDGDVRAGAPLAYQDNGDGTITDLNTGLMWEKKDDAGGIHDKDNKYTWGITTAPYSMTGTVMTEFLAALNTPPGFAGHTDWRIPNMRELASIINYESGDTYFAVDPALNTACTAGCSAASCSCTLYDHYWSSTTTQSNPTLAWTLDFRSGFTGNFNKSFSRYVRAVRGGL